MSLVRVLVVDDHEPFRRAASAVVRAVPRFVLAGVATTAEESLALAASGLAGRVDLVLMDVNLPGMDGITAAARLGELVDPPRVLLLSTYAEDEIADRLPRGRGVAYLAKSRFGPDQLVTAWTSLSRPSAPPEPGAE